MSTGSSMVSLCVGGHIRVLLALLVPALGEGLINLVKYKETELIEGEVNGEWEVVHFQGH